MHVVYGIKNCDSVKKARQWLEHHGVSYRFHDFRVDGLDSELLSRFIERLGVDALVNQRSTTWRQIDDATKSKLTPELTAKLLLEQPTLIKRPILDDGDQLIVGFQSDRYPR